MKTLADMTPEQRAECIGMWATVATERYPAVIVRTYVGNPDFAQMLAPELDDYYTANLDSVTPRFDRPRAWGADCKPVPMLAEYAVLNGPKRRFVTEWEPTPEGT